VFAMLDTDGDGAVSRAEYLARVDRVASAMGRDAGDPVVAAARSAHEVVFQDMDADHDGRVSFDEYRSWVGENSFEQTCRPALGAMFDLADADADGRLDREEFIRLRVAAGNSDSDAGAAFDALDGDREGFVDRDTYLAGIRSFVTTGVSAVAVMYGPGRAVPGKV
jgi:hypothetical protein